MSKQTKKNQKNVETKTVETITPTEQVEAKETIEQVKPLEQVEEVKELETIQESESAKGETIPDAIVKDEVQAEVEHNVEAHEKMLQDIENLYTDIDELLMKMRDDGDKAGLDRVFEFLQNGCSATPKADKKDKKYRETVERVEITKQERELIKAANVAPTALLRWMGKNGFTPARAAMVMDVLEIPVSQSTIECQVRGWESRGKIPVLAKNVNDVMEHFM